MCPDFKAIHFCLESKHSSFISPILVLGIDDAPDNSRSVWPVILFDVSLGIVQVNMICDAITILHNSTTQ